VQYYFCGSGNVALGVKGKLADIVLEAKGGDKEEATAYLAQLSKVSRFATDIFD
jgi:sulfite reductase alpha subunit-like flavoprotein